MTMRISVDGRIEGGVRQNQLDLGAYPVWRFTGRYHVVMSELQGGEWLASHSGEDRFVSFVGSIGRALRWATLCAEHGPDVATRHKDSEAQRFRIDEALRRWRQKKAG